ncbi:MAG: epimerase [Gemmatimonadetes bacterium]|nr:epimerase [Gemmatimonadota bacterium]
MDVLLFGATGMLGQGTLRECLLDPGVSRVVTVGRRATGQQHPKLREIVVPDVADLSSVSAELAGFDACFFTLGVSSARMTEARYSVVTYDLTVSIARTLLPLNPAMTFVFVSGMGTDSTERGRVMWARVKGRAENAVLAMGFRAAYIFRPGVVIPMHGITSATRWYRALYAAAKPLFLLAKTLFPKSVITTEQFGRAMLAVARNGYPKPILEARDIAAVSSPPT